MLTFRIYCRRVSKCLASIEAAKSEGRPLQLAQLLIEPSWKAALRAEFDKAYMPRLEAFLRGEWAAAKIFPPQHLIFRHNTILGGIFDAISIKTSSCLECNIMLW